MTKVAGRKVRIKQGTGGSAVLIAGGRSDSITINNEAIDITDKGDDGWRTLLDEASVRSVDGSVAGLVSNDSLIAQSVGPTSSLLGEYEIEVQGVGVFSGQFWFSNIDLQAPHDDAFEFTASFASSGEITWTPAGGSGSGA
jgi:TP901-1 family phage major tail protein